MDITSSFDPRWVHTFAWIHDNVARDTFREADTGANAGSFSSFSSLSSKCIANATYDKYECKMSGVSPGILAIPPMGD